MASSLPALGISEAFKVLKISLVFSTSLFIKLARPNTFVPDGKNYDLIVYIKF
jgi:hypothetical protein